MRILFQGGWKKGRDADELRPRILAFCQAFAQRLAKSRHMAILSSPREYDQLIADEIAKVCADSGRNPKDAITYLLSDRYMEYPRVGRVEIFHGSRWWLEERTHLVQESDAIVAIGGGRGTSDSIQKAFLANKPVFVAGTVSPKAMRIWNRRPADYHYLEAGDTEFNSDLNCGPEEFSDRLFEVVDLLDSDRFPRRVFIIHGRDHYTRDVLAEVLHELDFEAIVLEREPSHSLTIIEKLEREIANIGFSFILYTPDDLGRIAGGTENPRARQNVLFEHGVLVGRMRRNRTCALVMGEIELPSDLSGVLYERISDIRREAIRIAQILSEAGYRVDTNNLLNRSSD